jgi:ABC-type transport system substrate-binding protein
MGKRVVWAALASLIVAALVLSSCGNNTTTATATANTNTTSTTTTASTTVTTGTSPTTSTVKTTSSTGTGKWWDKLGVPQYGGQIVIRVPKDITGFDPTKSYGLFVIFPAWMDKLTGDDWTVDPKEFAYTIAMRPSQYIGNYMAASWEMPTTTTYVFHLRQGIHWQNIDPANGREFVASDMVYTFNRILGWGDGFTKPVAFSTTEWADLQSVTAPDKYTVVFTWKTPNVEYIVETIQGTNSSLTPLNREAITKWGDLMDWHHAIGTGPFMLTDFVTGASALMVKNPDYWGYDERYPQNKLPYADSLKVLVIPDDATALAGLRTGKIDGMDNLTIQQTNSLMKTNPELIKNVIPRITGLTVDPRNDVKPFNDIRVREAMQLAIDLPSIAKNYYEGTTDPYPVTLTSRYITGWGYQWEQWPQELKDQYTYNVAGAKKLLADAGYPNGFTTNIVADNSGDLDLLQIVQSQFKAVGITMDIRVMDSSSWTAFVSQGKKHDQMAMRASGLLGLTYELLRQLLRFQTGYTTNWILVSDPVYDAFYPAAVSASSIEANKEINRKANEYVARQHFTISLLHPMLFSLNQPWFKGFTGQNMAISGGTSGPVLLGFYASRFWIDQDMKKKLGH